MTSEHAEIPQNQRRNSGHSTGDPSSNEAIHSEAIAALAKAVDESFSPTLGSLKDLVGIPGIAWPSFDPAELDRSAEAVASLVRATGMDDVRILRCDKLDGTPGGPAVVARRPARDGKPTILLYAH